MNELLGYTLIYFGMMWIMLETIVFSQDEEFVLDQIIESEFDDYGTIGVILFYFLAILFAPLIIKFAWRDNCTADIKEEDEFKFLTEVDFATDEEYIVHLMQFSKSRLENEISNIERAIDKEYISQDVGNISLGYYIEALHRKCI